MVGMGYYSGIGSPVDPEQERYPPPPPTVVYFPQNDIPPSEFKPDESWSRHTPNLSRRFGHISRPSDITVEHLKALNLSEETDVSLEQIIPSSSDGHDYLPSTLGAGPTSRRNSSFIGSRPSTTVPSSGALRNQLLSNGHKAPDDDSFMKHFRELTYENEDGWRKIQNRKPRPGYPTGHITHMRRFWTQLALIATYWDVSLDHYYQAGSEPAESKPPKSPKGLKRFGLAMLPKETETHKSGGKKYKGRRTSTGSRMPETFRVDLIRHFIEPIVIAFGCAMMMPKKMPHMEIGHLRLPVTQNAMIWRNSQDKAMAKRGVTEGPVMGLQCRGETHFIKEKWASALDTAREFAGLLLLAEERAREGKVSHRPGEGQWYVTKPRWGGGPGGEFGEAEGNTDHAPPGGKRRTMPISLPKGSNKSEEEIWKELKPNPSLWEPHHTYLAIGKDRGEQFDNVFMISSLFHHLAILKLTVHPLYTDWLLTGKVPKAVPREILWHQPQIERTRWYDLLDPHDRGEAFRGVWGVMAYQMRSGDNLQSDPGQRQKSDSHTHHFSLRKKAIQMTPADTPQRSSSVAF